MAEWTEERLRKIVEEQLPGAVYGWRTDQAVDLCCEERGTSVHLTSPSRHNTCAMLAAAILAPRLWALVEAAKKWKEAQREFLLPPGVIGGRAEQRRVALRYADAQRKLRAALARVEAPEEGKEQTDEA